MTPDIDELVEGIRNEFSEELRVQPGIINRKFSKEFKEKLTTLSREKDFSLSFLSRRLGVSLSTVHEWQKKKQNKPNFIKKKKESLFHKLEIQPSNPLSQWYIEGKKVIKVYGLSIGELSELLGCL